MQLISLARQSEFLVQSQSLGVKEGDLSKIAEDAFNDVCSPGNPSRCLD